METLRRKLTDYLVATGDPRFTGAPAVFDAAPYRAPDLEEYLRKHGDDGRSE